jgi:hypothetical protein
MKTLTLEEMKKLPTKRLLAYKRKLMRTRFAVDDWAWGCSCSDCVRQVKASEETESLIEMTKEVLATRDHIPR